MFVDSHAHIDGEEFDADRDEVVARAREAGVRAILNVGTGDPHAGNFERAVAAAEKYEGVHAAVGVHPHDAKLYDGAAERLLLEFVGSRRVVALGEIGLDYHYDHSPREAQREVFARQLRLARQRGLPVIIHSRDADDDTLEILRAEYEGAGRGGRDALLRRRPRAGRNGSRAGLPHLVRGQRHLQEGRRAARGR
ncbi:MAG TPA: TatD family hydrolase, partial [Pyrinomonadaceae bacterium]